MGKARQIKIDTRLFEKAGDATAFFRQILNSYRVGEQVNDTDSTELYALLKRHDEVDEKMGSGISHFVVERAPEPHPGKCFWIVRTDGSKIDFSFPHCLERKPYD